MKGTPNSSNSRAKVPLLQKQKPRFSSQNAASPETLMSTFDVAAVRPSRSASLLQCRLSLREREREREGRCGAIRTRAKTRTPPLAPHHHPLFPGGRRCWACSILSGSAVVLCPASGAATRASVKVASPHAVAIELTGSVTRRCIFPWHWHLCVETLAPPAGCERTPACTRRPCTC